MKNQIALVTGANRGIGLEICRQLAKTGGVRVILTSRDAAKGKHAAETLKKEGLVIYFHPLDVTDQKSVDTLVAWVKKEYGQLDILINNAGILIDERSASLLTTKKETLQQTLETNLYGPWRLCQAFIPLMKKNNYGRVVNLSSGLGQLSDMGSGTPSYRISKTSLNALTRILAAELNDTNIKINSMCPGWVRTEMGGKQAPRSVEQGADTAIWLATLPNDGPTGGFFRDRKAISW